MYKVMAFRSVGYMFKFSILCFCKSVLYATFVKVLCCSNAIDYQDKNGCCKLSLLKKVWDTDGEENGGRS